MTMIELRCPVKSRRMFGRLLAAEKPVITDGNLLEFSCKDCRDLTPGAIRVLHRFDMSGELVETLELMSGAGPDASAG